MQVSRSSPASREPKEARACQARAWTDPAHRAQDPPRRSSLAFASSYIPTAPPPAQRRMPQIRTFFFANPPGPPTRPPPRDVPGLTPASAPPPLSGIRPCGVRSRLGRGIRQLLPCRPGRAGDSDGGTGSGSGCGIGCGAGPEVRGGAGVRGWARSRNRGSSAGNGSTGVEFFSAATATTVCGSRSRSRSWSTDGVSSVRRAASASFFESGRPPHAGCVRGPWKRCAGDGGRQPTLTP
jgi:hypothetical protein